MSLSMTAVIRFNKFFKCRRHGFRQLDVAIQMPLSITAAIGTNAFNTSVMVSDNWRY